MSFVTSWMGAPVLPLVALDPNSNAYPAGRHLGDVAGLSHVDPDLIADNIAAGITIFGVLGTFMYWDRYIPANIASSKSLSVKAAADQSITKNALLAAAYKYAYTDDPTDFIKLKTPALASSVTPTMIAAADQSKAITAGPMHRFYDIMLVVTAAIAYNNTGSVYTNETANADGYVTNGMTLLPAVPSTNCAYYFGFPYLFDSISLVIGTQGAGTWTIVWEYWNGGAWAALTGVTDGTSGFTSGTGTKTVTFTRGAGWATTSVNAVGPYYYVRARVSAYTSITTQPKGSGSSLVKTTYN